MRGLAKVLPSGGRESPESADDTDPPATVAYVTEIDTPAGANSATRTGSVLGTPAYMPPEQAGGEIRKLDPRSDVFGLGAMLCVILTGKPPYSGTDANAVRTVVPRYVREIRKKYLSVALPFRMMLCKRHLEAEAKGRTHELPFHLLLPFGETLSLSLSLSLGILAIAMIGTWQFVPPTNVECAKFEFRTFR